MWRYLVTYKYIQRCGRRCPSSNQIRSHHYRHPPPLFGHIYISNPTYHYHQHNINAGKMRREVFPLTISAFCCGSAVGILAVEGKFKRTQSNIYQTLLVSVRILQTMPSSPSPTPSSSSSSSSPSSTPSSSPPSSQPLSSSLIFIISVVRTVVTTINCYQSNIQEETHIAWWENVRIISG